MIPIKKLGFISLRETYLPNDTDIKALVECLLNAWGLERQDIWVRQTFKSAYEVALVISHTRDLKSVETLIRIDSMLEGFRARDFALGEIKPAIASYALISIFDMRSET